ncbi:MAG TPA: hypothetical protein VG013_29715 [Gemmataceae bacterium]|nr:hypothetical protein [Gemmataceae bacterium]
MTNPLTLDCALPPSRRRYTPRRRERTGTVQPRSTVAGSRIPRVSRLMALAWRLDELLRSGVVADYAALARLGHVSRARISQIMSLLSLAPDIQEALLFLPPVVHGRDPMHLRQLLPLSARLDWREQRRLWQALAGRSGSDPADGHA